MAEHPILFSAEMVRAILDGRKTQTRRIAPIRELNILQHPGDMLTWSVSFLKAIKGTLASHSGGKFSDLQARSIIASQFNPYGRPGDLLWVRETWGRTTNVNDSPLWPNRAHIPMHGGEVVIFAADGHWQWCDGDGFATERSFWRPSIHMPRWASRITLRITDVRVERLQDISEDDAGAEGMPDYSTLSEASGENLTEAQTRLRWRQRQFASLWTSINGPGAWDDNPWVWALTFERVKP
jgi:hypothetical protein